MEDNLETICNSLPEEDLELYLDLIIHSRFGDRVSDQFEALKDRGYGDSIREVDTYFKKHFKFCEVCNSKHQTNLACISMFVSPKKFHKEFGKQCGFDDSNVERDQRIVKLIISFAPQHIEYEEEAYEIKDYLIAKINEKDVEPNPEYDKHIKNCDYCKKLIQAYEK